MEKVSKGLKRLRGEFKSYRERTEPTPGSQTQKRKANKAAHQQRLKEKR